MAVGSEGSTEVLCVCQHSEGAHRLGGTGACAFCHCTHFRLAVSTGKPSHQEARAPREALAALKKTRALQALSARQLSRVASRVRRRLLLAGAVLVRAGAVTSLLFVLAKGTVRVTSAAASPVQLQPGALIADLGAFTGKAWQVSVVAAEDVELFELDAADLRTVLTGTPHLLTQVVLATNQEMHGWRQTGSPGPSRRIAWDSDDGGDSSGS